MIIYLFGGYALTGHFPSGQPVQQRFWFRWLAEWAANSYEPVYGQYLTGPIVKIPGKWARHTK